MVIENTGAAMRAWLRNLISTVLLGVSMVVIHMTPVLDKDILGIGALEITLLLLVIYLFIILRPIILKYQFIYVSLENGSISIKYYTMGFIPGARKSFEFPAKEFNKFELKNSLFSLREDIVLYRKLDKGIAKYPPLSLTALKAEQREKLLSLFTKLGDNKGN